MRFLFRSQPARLLLLALLIGWPLAVGCSSAPGVATEAETKESMQDTMDFDPMEGADAGIEGTPAPGP